MLKTFKNKLFTADSDCTNKVYCTADAAPNENWVECDPSENNLKQLFLQNGVRYYGYL